MEKRTYKKDKVKVGLVQFSPERRNIQNNHRKIEDILKNATADIIVLPELSTTGYLFKEKEEIFELASPVPHGRDVEFFENIARKKKMYIVAGVAEREDSSVYNTAVLVGPDGFIGKYRKTHLFYKEKLIFSAGNTGFQVFDVKGVKIGMMICFDYFFPESTRTLALKGAEIIAHPSNLVLPYCQEVVKTRALENRVFIITANRIGEEEVEKEKMVFTGKSQITNPKGDIVLRVSEEAVGLWEIEINLSLSRNKKINPFNHVINDRRPEFYYKG